MFGNTQPLHANADSKLRQIRELFNKNEKLDGYLIANFDQHGSEFLADRDRRLLFISGFSGSGGIAIITDFKACVWVDGRYHLQAEKELINPFQVMKCGNKGVPTESDWLIMNFPQGGVIGACGKYVPSSIWLMMEHNLEKFNIRLVDVVSDFVELIWLDRPPQPENPIVPHSTTYSGLSASNKISKIYDMMSMRKVDMLVISELDDIAWLLNLRGSDIPYNPVFFSFVVLTQEQIDFFANSISESLVGHFGSEKIEVNEHLYTDFYDVLHEVSRDEEIGRVWISEKANHLIYTTIPLKKVYVEISPVSIRKCVKNHTEASGMIEAYVYDGYALCKFFCWLNKELKRKAAQTELSALQKLEYFKKKNTDYVGPSFATISASGEHSALVHYQVTPESNKRLSLNDIYLCGSGSQYLCGTTNVTRTYHFGKPTYYQKECYTRVFKSQVALSKAIFPESITGASLDVLARFQLWQVGLDYDHGTGHGIGSYLNVHEGPISINYKRNDMFGLKMNMFVSNEPGYYKEHSFGIRLGNIEHVVLSETSERDRKYLGFETVTICPYQNSLLLPSLLTESEIKFLNNYHNRIRNILCPVYKAEKDVDTLQWVTKMTESLVT